MSLDLRENLRNLTVGEHFVFYGCSVEFFGNRQFALTETFDIHIFESYIVCIKRVSANKFINYKLPIYNRDNRLIKVSKEDIITYIDERERFGFSEYLSFEDTVTGIMADIPIFKTLNEMNKFQQTILIPEYDSILEQVAQEIKNKKMEWIAIQEKYPEDFI